MNYKTSLGAIAVLGTVVSTSSILSENASADTMKAVDFTDSIAQLSTTQLPTNEENLLDPNTVTPSEKNNLSEGDNVTTPSNDPEKTVETAPSDNNSEEKTDSQKDPDANGSKEEENTGNNGATSKPKPTSPAEKPTTPSKPTPNPKPTTDGKKPSSKPKPQNPTKPKQPASPAKNQSTGSKATHQAVSRPQSVVKEEPVSYANTQTNSDYETADIRGKIVYTGKVAEKINDAAPIKKVDTKTPDSFIKSLAPRVQIMAGKNNLYASIILAQAILESGYGQSNLFEDHFNIFNITGSYLGKFTEINTLEYDKNGKPYFTSQKFRVYSTYEQSLADYINLMLHGTTWNKKIYAGTWKTEAKTYQDAAQALQGVYATDPEYAQKLIEIIKQYKLYQYDNVVSTTQVIGKDVPKSPLVEKMSGDSSFPIYNSVQYPGSDSYAFGNCTQYVYNRIFQLGGYIGQQMGNGGDWGISGALQGYYTTSIPMEGYAVSFPPEVAGASQAYGHVAFVEKVYPDGSILISEMNVKGLNIVSERHIDAGSAALATYIQPK